MDEVTSKLIFRLKLFYLLENAFQATMRFKLMIDFVDYYFSSIRTSRYCHRISVFFRFFFLGIFGTILCSNYPVYCLFTSCFSAPTICSGSTKRRLLSDGFFARSNHKRTVHKQLWLAEFLVDCKSAISSTEKPANISIPRCIWLEFIVIFPNKMMQFSAKLK